MSNFDYNNSSDIEKLNHIAAVTLDQIKALIDQLIDVYDLDFVKDEHLNIIASILGYPLDREDDNEFKRRQLKAAIDSYKAKGTEESIRVLFYTMGLNVEVIPLWTPDFREEITLTPPYVRIASTPENSEGFKDVILINPDSQYHTFKDSYKYL